MSTAVMTRTATTESPPRRAPYKRAHYRARFHYVVTYTQRASKQCTRTAALHSGGSTTSPRTLHKPPYVTLNPAFTGPAANVIKLAHSLHRLMQSQFRGPWYRQAGESPLLLLHQADQQPPAPVHLFSAPLAAQRTGSQHSQQQILSFTLQPPIGQAPLHL